MAALTALLAFADLAVATEERRGEHPFEAYPWFPVPDALTRERPDGALAGPVDRPPPVYSVYRDADYDPAWGNGTAEKDIFSAIKLIPLDRERKFYLTLGGEIRERFEYWNNENFGVIPEMAGENAFWLQRIMMHLDLRMGPYVRFLFQGKSNLHEGRSDGARRVVDEDEIDLHQAYAEITIPYSDADWLAVRGGRQEVAFGTGRLLNAREGPNVRLSWDGVRTMLRWDNWELDNFWLQFVNTEEFDFNDSTSDYQVWGAYLAGPGLFEQTGSNFYYIGDYRRSAVYIAGVESEVRHTLGTRLFGRSGSADFDVEGAWQTGTFGPATIAAWFVSGQAGYAFTPLFGKPHLALKADIFSGNHSAPVDQGGRTLATFNTLFPRGNLFSEPAPIGQQNIIALHPQLDWYPSEQVVMTLAPIFYWRQSMKDGIYNWGGFPITPGTPDSGRYTGTEIWVQADYWFNKHLRLSIAYDHFFISDFFAGIPEARDYDFVAVWGVFKF
ncbi:MAG: alginate export family protein [Candidatus Binatia bacterium]